MSSKAAADLKVRCTEMQKESDLLQITVIQAEEAAKREEALSAQRCKSNKRCMSSRH